MASPQTGIFTLGTSSHPYLGGTARPRSSGLHTPQDKARPGQWDDDARKRHCEPSTSLLPGPGRSPRSSHGADRLPNR
jgi:hypothetical protein